jgi:sugar fermentation stimulation protein A
MRLFQKIEKSFFKARLNRFVVACIVQNKTVRAYLPNPGRLWELLLPGRILYLVQQSAPSVTIRYMVVAVEKNGSPILLHTHLNNVVARHLIEHNRVPGLEGSVIVRPEVKMGKSRFDFLLNKGGQEIVLEVKSCTLFSGRIAMFPDAVTLRGKRHLIELASLSGKKRKAAVLFIVHSPRIDYFLPEYHTDLEFSRALLSVSDTVMVKAVSARWNKDLRLGSKTRDLFIPWGLIRKESHDSGSYIVILRVKRNRKIFTGSLGEVRFRKGYYMYVGSARRNLSKRIARHQRRRKNMFWHIDYLRAYADFHTSLPVRASVALECEMAEAIEKISQWNIPGFGSSDCTCKSHLFGMSDDPVRSPSFIDTLMYFRIDRLERALNDRPDT